MSINIGNSKIGKIYVGSTAIGKVYKGSELVWESGLRLYGYKDDELLLNIGGIGTSYPVIYFYSQTSFTYSKFTAISGTLGASGSKITIDGDQYTYKNSVNVNGTTIYIYVYSDSSSWLTIYSWAWVLKGTTTNQSKVIVQLLGKGDGSDIPYPYSANSTELKYFSSSDGAPRYSAADTTWK